MSNYLFDPNYYRPRRGQIGMWMGRAVIIDEGAPEPISEMGGDWVDAVGVIAFCSLVGYLLFLLFRAFGWI